MTQQQHDFAIWRSPLIRHRLLVLLLGATLWIPLGELPLWRYLYGFTGELSPATWAIFFVWLGFPDLFRHWCHAELPWRGRLGLFLGMLLFYVLALGSWAFDPYVYGYQPWVLLVMLGAWVAWRGRLAPGITLLLALDLATFGLHGLTSDNLWDYLFDPVLMMALGISVFRGVMSRRFKLTD
jgi:hypothetical protein